MHLALQLTLNNVPSCAKPFDLSVHVLVLRTIHRASDQKSVSKWFASILPLPVPFELHLELQYKQTNNNK